MSVKEQKNKEEPEKEIRQPRAGGHGKFLFDEDNKNLDNPRKILWKLRTYAPS